MTNLMEETLEHIREVSTKENNRVKCAIINDDHFASEHRDAEYMLKENYTELEYGTFLHLISRDYDSSYGTQYYHGTIWYDDGTWSERREYDGSEWWSYCKSPAIPTQCKESKMITIIEDQKQDRTFAFLSQQESVTFPILITYTEDGEFSYVYGTIAMERRDLKDWFDYHDTTIQNVKFWVSVNGKDTIVLESEYIIPRLEEWEELFRKELGS